MAVDAAAGAASIPATRERASLLEQTLAVGRRSVVRTSRQRALLIFPMVFPLILFAINGSALSAATKIPRFPTDNYRDFLIAVPFVQGAMFVSITAGVDLARDIETGFLNRLAMTPLRGEALLIGQLGGALLLGVIQAVVYLLVALATGVTIVSGVGGALVLLLLSVLISFGFASLGGLLALQLPFPLRPSRSKAFNRKGRKEIRKERQENHDSTCSQCPNLLIFTTKSANCLSLASTAPKCPPASPRF